MNGFCLNSRFPAVFERSEMPLFSCWLCTWLCVWLCIFELTKTKHVVWLCIWLCILLSFFMRLEYARLLLNGCIFRFRYYWSIEVYLCKYLFVPIYFMLYFCILNYYIFLPCQAVLQFVYSSNCISSLCFQTIKTICAYFPVPHTPCGSSQQESPVRHIRGFCW